MKNPVLDKICKLFVIICYMITAFGIPLFLSISFLRETLNGTLMGFFAWTGYGILFISYALFIMAIFGYAVGEE